MCVKGTEPSWSVEVVDNGAVERQRGDRTSLQSGTRKLLGLFPHVVKELDVPRHAFSTTLPCIVPLRPLQPPPALAEAKSWSSFGLISVCNEPSLPLRLLGY